MIGYDVRNRYRHQVIFTYIALFVLFQDLEQRFPVRNKGMLQYSMLYLKRVLYSLA